MNLSSLYPPIEDQRESFSRNTEKESLPVKHSRCMKNFTLSEGSKSATRHAARIKLQYKVAVIILMVYPHAQSLNLFPDTSIFKLSELIERIGMSGVHL